MYRWLVVYQECIIWKQQQYSGFTSKINCTISQIMVTLILTFFLSAFVTVYVLYRNGFGKQKYNISQGIQE